MHSRQMFFLISTALSPIVDGPMFPNIVFFILRISKSTRATFLLDMASTAPRLAARKDFPSPEIDDEIAITFLLPPEVKKSKFVRSDRMASLAIDRGLL